MYESLKRLLLRILRVPHEPAPPAGNAASLRMFRASPQYLRYRLLGWALAQAWVLFIATIAFFSFMGALTAQSIPPFVRAGIEIFEIFGIIVIACGVLLSFLTIRLDFEMRYYMVTDRSLRIREGVWNVHEMTMTFANIQNITIEQGPLQRLFGIANVRVQSAGGGQAHGDPHGGKGAVRHLHVGWFRGVDDAPAIRDLIFARLKALRDAGLGDHDDAHHAEAAPQEGGVMIPLLAELRDEMRALRVAAEQSRG